MDKMLKDKVAIVTGSGRGIGQATAKLFAQEGAKVMVCDLDRGSCQETVDSIIATGGTSIPYVGDLTKKDVPEKIVEATVKVFGPSIDIIVNNAGYSGAEFICKATDALWEKMFEIHTTVPFKIVRAACPYMRDQAKMEITSGKKTRCRKIINISSFAGTDGMVLASSAYASAKAAIIGFTKSLAKEFGPFNICVNALALGFVDTRMSQPPKEGGEERIGDFVIGFPKKAREEFINLTPLGRIGTVQEVAGSILFLSSHLSNYITGQVIKVSGGL